MTAAAVLSRLHGLGVVVVARGESLALRPASAVPAALLAEVKLHKAGVLALLATAAPEQAAGTSPVDHAIIVCAVPVRVAVMFDQGAVAGVIVVTSDDERRALADAVNRELQAGRSLADQAVRQVAMTDLIRELRRIELAVETGRLNGGSP